MVGGYVVPAGWPGTVDEYRRYRIEASLFLILLYYSAHA